MTPIQKARQYFAGKNVLVFGLGLLGGALGDVRFLISCGAKVRITDQKTAGELAPTLQQLKGFDISYTLGDHKKSDIDQADIILRNPSIPRHHELLLYAETLHKPVEMRSSLFAYLAGIPVIGITGTRGKTTTTYMIYELARQLLPDKQILLGGNIAHTSDLELLPKATSNSLAVLELSSWQLQGFAAKQISPHIAVLTNLYPDHLNQYESLEAYYADKRLIIAHQTANDYAVLNREQREFHRFAGSSPATIAWFSPNEVPDSMQLKISGRHNLANAAAALQVARILSIPEDSAIKVLNGFSGVPYRQQVVATKQGITYVNDTTATTPVAAAIALETYPGAVLIAGGSDKNLPVDELIQAINTKARRVILLHGNGTDRIKEKLDPDKIIATVTSMPEAVQAAAAAAKAGETVLLSPGFTSFGLFTNEFDRGDQFNTCVNELPGTGDPKL